MTTRPTTTAPDADIPSVRDSVLARTASPVAHTTTGTWRAHTAPWRGEEGANSPSAPAGQPAAVGQQQALAQDFGAAVQPDPPSGQWKVGTTQFGIPTPAQRHAAQSPTAQEEASSQGTGVDGAAADTSTSRRGGGPAHGEQQQPGAVAASELIARLGGGTSRPRRRGRHLVEDADTPAAGAAGTDELSQSPSPQQAPAAPEEPTPAAPAEHVAGLPAHDSGLPQVRVVEDAAGDSAPLAPQVARQVAATRGFSATPAGAWAAITDLRQVRQEAATAARAQHPAGTSEAFSSPDPAAGEATKNPADTTAHDAGDEQHPHPVCEDAVAEVGSADEPPADEVVAADQPQPAPAPLAPLVPRTPPRFLSSPPDSPLKARAVAHRRPAAGPYESFAALWAVPDGAQAGMSRPSQRRALRRWLWALVCAALMATAGVVLLVYGVLDGAEWAVPAAKGLVGAAAVVALVSEAALRPRQGVC